MILTVEDAFVPDKVGNKAMVLQQLHKEGFKVPKFVVLPTDIVHNFSAELELSTVIKKKLPAKLYAVRSAALLEDTATTAMAGQFHTKLAVTLDELEAAVAEVAAQAFTVPGFEADSLSIIIQEFVEPDFAGVWFTRNPQGGFEAVCEYVEGRGEEVVSGRKATRKHYFAPPAMQGADQLPFADELYKKTKEIEQLLDSPQDIEWAYSKNELYILQSRDITTLPEKSLQCYEYLDHTLPVEPYIYEKTSITETFSKPSPLAVSFLQFLHATHGPIAKTYHSLGIKYVETNQFVLVGTELYVDKQLETKALFPALGFIKHQSTVPRVETLTGLWTTLWNTRKLKQISTQPAAISHHRLIEYLKKDSPQTLLDVLDTLNSMYPLIFRINLYSQLSLGRLQVMANDAKLVTEMLQNTNPSQLIDIRKDEISQSLVGNSISPDDTSVFVAQAFPAQQDVNLTPKHWKQKALLPKVIEVQNLMQLRELGRWVSVKLVTELRAAVECKVTEAGLDTKLGHFITISELQSTLPSQTVLLEREQVHSSLNECTFPAVLSNFAASSTESEQSVLSAGQTQGILCTAQTLSECNGRKILLVDALTPDLTNYFAEVDGIVCSRGGMLSHLAIMAREANLPVIVKTKSVKQWLGAQVEITAEGVLQLKNEA